MKRVLLVYPRFPVTYWGFQRCLEIFKIPAALPPLGLVTLAAGLPGQWPCRLVDLNIEELDDEVLAWADVVLVGGMLVQSESMLDVVRRAKAQSCRVVVGGPAATTAGELFAEADAVFAGEVEERMDQLVEAMVAEGGDGLPHRLSRVDGDLPSMSAVPVPRYDLLRWRSYMSMSIQYSRGCPFGCEFCDVIQIFGRKPRVKSSEQVLAELQAIYDLGFRGSIFFVDDNFIGNRRAVRQLLPLLARWQEERHRPFDLYTEASVNLASDGELMTEMVAAGFRSVFVGIETPSPEALREAGKLQNLKLDLHQAVERLTRAGLEVMGGFIVGFDHDTPAAIEALIRFIQEAPIPLAMVGLMMALPGTDLWHRLEREGRLRGRPSGDQFARPNFEPLIDEVELLRGYESLIAHLYDPDHYYERCQRFIDLVGRTPAGGHQPVADTLAFVRGTWAVGVKSRNRWRFWKLMARALVRSPHVVRHAFVDAVRGEHMIRYSQQDVLPRIGHSLQQVRDERAWPGHCPPRARPSDHVGSSRSSLGEGGPTTSAALVSPSSAEASAG